METATVRINRDILPVLSPRIVTVLHNVPINLMEQVTEIRLRTNRPLLLMLGTHDVMINANGQPVAEYGQAYKLSLEEMEQTLQLICRNSIYAYEQELRMGYITIGGGHRVGLVGQSILEAGTLKAMKNISSLNVRIAREVRGCADIIMPYIIVENRRVLSTLIISPPRCGKTTILRDIIRQISDGSSQWGFRGVQVGLVDERSEIAACQNGMPTVDLGSRIDVLDGCPKAYGMLMLIRSMSPQVVATDELGREEDVTAVQEALHAGVSVIATVHGRDIEDVGRRPYISELIRGQYFERYVLLTDDPCIGTVDKIVAGKPGTVLFSRTSGVKICG